MSANDALARAAAAPPIVDTHEIDLSDIPETDFSVPNAVRGKHYARFIAATGLVKLAPDVRQAFPDDDSVNRALRHLLEIVKEVRS